MNEFTTDTAAAPPPVFDLGDMSAADVGNLTVVHPKTGAPTTWIIELAGPGHPVSIAVSAEATRENVRREREQARELSLALARGRKAKLPDIEVDTEGDRDRTLARVARKILGWTPVAMNGADFPFTPANVQMLLKDPRYSWAATQIFDFLAEDENFIAGSVKT